MKPPSLFLRLLSVYFALWLAVPVSVWAGFAITGRVGLAGAERTNAHLILWSPVLGPDINSQKFFAYTSDDWLTTDGTDANGNTANSAGSTYRYDAENLLTDHNAGAAAFVQDGDVHRRIKAVDGVTTCFLVDARSPNGFAQVVEELTAPNAVPVRLYTHGLDLIRQRQGSGASYYGYAGNSTDPLSLHRYLYCDDDPVNFIDPGGSQTAVVLTATGSGGMLAQIMSSVLTGSKVAAAALPKLDFSPKDTDAGIVERLLLAESLTPFAPKNSYNKADVLSGMSAIGACIVNRVKTEGFPGTIKGVITEKSQFHGFDTYPDGDPHIRERLIDVLKYANTKNAKQTEFRALVEQAKAVAKQVVEQKVPDPFQSKGGTYFFRTKNSGPPGPLDKMPPLGSLGGNTFYSLTSPQLK